MVGASVAKGTHLDVFATLPSLSESETHEFLADVSSFANGAGGDLLYGVMTDAEGRAAAISAHDGAISEEVARLDCMASVGIEPPVPGLTFHCIAVRGGHVIVVRVPQSWAAPHRVRSSRNFYVREDGHRRELGLAELQGLFLRSESQSQRVEDFRTMRVGKMVSGTIPHRLVKGARLLAHFVPTRAALSALSVDPVPYASERSLPILGPFRSSTRMTVDGALVLSEPKNEGAEAYSVLFRNGFFESVRVLPYDPMGRTQLSASTAEALLIAAVADLREEYRFLGIGSEMTCLATILDADKVNFLTDHSEYQDAPHQGRFDRRFILLPSTLVADELTPTYALRPLFDVVWQAAGYERSMNYTADGVWIPGRKPLAKSS